MTNQNNKPLQILFVCVRKGIRASLAKAIIEQKSQATIEATCSGFEKGGTPPFVIEEVSSILDISFELEAKTVFEYRIAAQTFDYVITLCDEASSENCGIFRHIVRNTYSDAANHLTWSIPNFSLAQAMTGEARTLCVAEILKIIENEVDGFLANLKHSESPIIGDSLQVSTQVSPQ